MPTEGWHARATNGTDRLRRSRHPASTSCSPHRVCPLLRCPVFPPFSNMFPREPGVQNRPKQKQTPGRLLLHRPLRLRGSPSVLSLETEPRSLQGHGLTVSGLGSPRSSPEEYPHPQKQTCGYLLLPRPSEVYKVPLSLKKQRTP